MAYLNDFRTSAFASFTFGAVFWQTTKIVQRWAALAQERKTLGNLSYSQLEDIGVSADAANAEAARPFWASDCR